MKKIIATVLAMVMALALCTTAFADTVKLDGTGYAGYGKNGKEIEANAVYGYVSESATSNDNGGGTIAHYDVYKVVSDDSGSTATKYATYVKSTKADFDLKLTKDNASTLYLTEIKGADYVAKAEAFTKIGDKCGQLDKDEDGKYYTNTKKFTSGNTEYDVGEAFFKQLADDSADATRVLVDGKLIPVNLLENAKLVGHTWVAVEKDGKVVSYKCSDCGQTAAIYKTKDAAKASGLKNIEAYVDDEGNSIFLAWTDGKTTGTTTGTNKPSPKTFDAGIAMYVGLALTSVAGSAVVIGKKKEF